jgi:hypothetical protein
MSAYGNFAQPVNFIRRKLPRAGIEMDVEIDARLNLTVAPAAMLLDGMSNIALF